MAETESNVRCPSCRRLLARRNPDGSLEVRVKHELRAIVKCGEVVCADCDMTVGVQSCSVQQPADVLVHTVR